MSELFEVFGRAHPMVLHVPIGFFLALALMEFFAPASAGAATQKSVGWLVLFTALSTIVTVVTGLVHGREPEFSGSTFEWHRNLGLALVPVALAAWWAHRRIASAANSGRGLYRIALVVGLGLLVPTGHFGFELTHGAGFLTEPLTREPIAAPVPPAAPSSYDSVIRPLLDARCADCHGGKKQKGGLSLATAESIAAGGRHGPALNLAAPATSLMLQRIELAIDHDKHMPPEDHDQPSAGELAALKAWLLAGAPFQGVVAGVQVDSASPVVSKATGTEAGLSALVPAAPAALSALRDALVHVQSISQDFPTLLWVDFAAVAKSLDDAKLRALLAPLTWQLCDVSLARTLVGNETIAWLATCKSLRRLDLRATALSDTGLAAFASHATLAELVLSQNKLTDAAVDSLISMGALTRVHLWRSGISPEAIARLKSARPELSIDDGATPDSVALEADTAIVLSKGPPAAPAVAALAAAAPLVPVNLKCPVTGSPVNPKYTIVHEGRVIGFCCPNCPKEFLADPAKFADRLN